MKSQKRSEASRVNGAKSRGPVTAEGRHKVAFNAMRHGLTSLSVVLSNESTERFQELFDTYIEQFQPDGEIEFGLVEEMVAAKWRIRRIWGIETSLLDVEMDVQEAALEKNFSEIDQGVRLALAFDGCVKRANSLALLSTHENRLSRAHDRAFRQLQELQAARRAAEQAEAPPATRDPAESDAAHHPTEPGSPADTAELFLQNEPENPPVIAPLRGPVRADSPIGPFLDSRPAAGGGEDSRSRRR